MIVILLSWCYIFFISITFGVTFLKFIRLEAHNTAITSISGLFCVTVLASFWTLFAPISLNFQITLLLTSLLLLLKRKGDFLSVLYSIKYTFKAFPFGLKVLFFVSSLLILVQSATLPFIIDNETYYIQTIKWLNEYGFVPGLANLHLFFGQTSGWHITQSVFSFSFLFDRFNDLNGYCLLLVNFWAFSKLHSYFSTKNQLDLVFGLLPITYIFLFQFVNSPSPDLPVYLFGLILFSLYLDEDNFILITVFALFLVYIKITALIFLLFPGIILLKNYRILKNKLTIAVSLSIVVFTVFIIKNSILTGYPLFPMTFISLPNVNFIVPKDVVDFFFSQSMMHSFYMPFGSFENSSLSDFAKHYFLLNGLDSFIAISTLLLLLFSPIVISKYFSKTSIWGIYFNFLLLLALLILSSPQYRFYVYFTLFFSLLWFSLVVKSENMVLVSFSFNFILIAILVFVPLSLNSITNNKSLAHNSTFQFNNILIPEPNTKSNQKYQLLKKQNLEYYSPIQYNFFWITGNGKLPCANQEQIHYFETNFQIIPQLRGKNLEDGFYAKKVNTNE